VLDGTGAWILKPGTLAYDALWDAVGDIAVATGANTAGVLTKGANHTHLVVADGEVYKLKWVAEFFTLPINLGNGVDVIGTGIQAVVPVDFAGVVVGWTVLAPKESGAIVIDIWKDTYANFPPTNADAMPGAGHEPKITATGNKGQDLDASDWATTAIAVGDVLLFNVDSCTTIKLCTVALKIQRTY
jgi:hypothetical protein